MHTPRKRPRQRRSKETVAAILDAAALLFRDAGYGATTTNKVAELAGVSIGSLYQYFPNKDALLVALAEEHLDAAADAVAAVLARAADERLSLPRMVAELVGSVADLHIREPDVHLLLLDQAPRSPELMARLRAMESRMAAALAGELRRLGTGGPDPELSALLTIQAVTAQIHGAVLTPPDGRSRDRAVDAVVRLTAAALAGGGAATGEMMRATTHRVVDS